MSGPPEFPETPKRAADQRLTGYRFVIGGLVALLGLGAGLNLFAFGPVTPLIIDEYGINHSTAGLLASLGFLVHGGSAIPSSMLVGRVGLKKLIFIGAVLGAAPLLSVFADSFAFLLMLRAVHGLSFAIIFPAIGPLLLQWFGRRELPLANGIFMTVGGAGMAISTFAVVPLTDVLDWKAALSVFGGVSLLGAVCWLVLGRVQSGVDENESRLPIGRAWGVVRDRNTLLLAIADAGPFALLTVALAWLPTFYHEVHGISLATAGTLMGLLSSAGVVSLVAASLLALRVRRRRPFLIVPGVLAGFAGFGSFLLADSAGVYVALLALGFGEYIGMRTHAERFR